MPLDRTLQLLQNYLFFKDVTIDDIYTVRKLLEPELAAGAVPHLGERDFAALEANIACCDGASGVHDRGHMLRQRQEDTTFHDILAAANPNPFLRFSCELINEMIRQLIEFRNDTPLVEHKRFGEANVSIHKAILQAARERDAERVRALMVEHMTEAPKHEADEGQAARAVDPRFRDPPAGRRARGGIRCGRNGSRRGLTAGERGVGATPRASQRTGSFSHAVTADAMRGRGGRPPRAAQAIAHARRDSPGRAPHRTVAHAYPVVPFVSRYSTRPNSAYSRPLPERL